MNYIASPHTHTRPFNGWNDEIIIYDSFHCDIYIFFVCICFRYYEWLHEYTIDIINNKKYILKLFITIFILNFNLISVTKSISIFTCVYFFFHSFKCRNLIQFFWKKINWKKNEMIYYCFVIGEWFNSYLIESVTENHGKKFRLRKLSLLKLKFTHHC